METAREMFDRRLRSLTRSPEDAKEATRLMYKAVGHYNSWTQMIDHDPRPQTIELTKFWTDPEEFVCTLQT